MPELPEVETVRRGLAGLILDKNISSIETDWAKSLPISEEDIKKQVIGSHFINIARRGKLLILELNTRHSLLVHLRMTGQLVFRSKSEKFAAGHPNDSLIGKLPDKSTRVIITFADGSKLFFNDQRKFGWMSLAENRNLDKIKFLEKMGPEPLEENFTFEVFLSRLKLRWNSQIKAVLLDQHIIAGIGNIYADESLWMSKVHPLTKVSDISISKLKVLHKSIVEVLLTSIEKGGSTDRNYVNAEGKKGSYISFAKVFRREGQACYRCGTVIKKMRAAGRGTHICPKCQKI